MYGPAICVIVFIIFVVVMLFYLLLLLFIYLSNVVLSIVLDVFVSLYKERIRPIHLYYFCF